MNFLIQSVVAIWLLAVLLEVGIAVGRLALAAVCGLLGFALTLLAYCLDGFTRLWKAAFD